MRSIASVRALSVYVSDKALAKTDAQTICKAIVSQVPLKSLDPPDHLEIIYGISNKNGSAGRVLSASALGFGKLPSYLEVASSGSQAVPVLSRTELDKSITAIEAEIVNMHSAKLNYNSRTFVFLDNKIQRLENQV